MDRRVSTDQQGTGRLRGPDADGAATATGYAPVQFGANGELKLAMFSDIHVGTPLDERTFATMEAVIDQERPDFVMLAGDITDGAVESEAAFREGLDRVAAPMEARGIPWAHVYGNHDEDHAWRTGLTAAVQQRLYEGFPHCVSSSGPPGIGGLGNFAIPVAPSSGAPEPAFAIWGLDSGRGGLATNQGWYPGDLLRDAALGTNLQGDHDYDFVKFGQLAWYWETSRELERAAGRKVPGLMFVHMPLPEHRVVAMNPEETRREGSRNEDECNSPINSGLFAALLQRGDVAGVFCGHDHINDYVGTYCGIRLGFDASVGFSTYGLPGPDRDAMRGARIFTISEDSPRGFRTWMCYPRLAARVGISS